MTAYADGLEKLSQTPPAAQAQLSQADTPDLHELERAGTRKQKG